MKANSYDNPGTSGGNLESVSEMLSLLSPAETPFISTIRKKSASATFPETLADTLRPVKITGQREGKKFSNINNKAGKRQRFGSYIQIFGESFGVTATQEAITKRGGNAVVDDEMAESEMRAMLDVKRDYEARALSAEEHQDGGDDERETRGFFKWVQASAQSVNPVPADFRPASAQILSGVGAPATFTEAQLYTVLQALAKVRGKRVNNLRGFAGENIVAVVDNFSRVQPSSTNQRYTVNTDAAKHEIDIMVNVFRTSHGTIEIIPDYFVKISADDAEGDANALAIADMELWELHELEELSSGERDTDSGGETNYVRGQAALLCKNPKGNGALYNT